MNCPVCHEQALGVEHRKSRGFKGASYAEEYYEHDDKECVKQSCFYPDYFGKGPKTIVHTWAHAKTPKVPKAREQISFINKGAVTGLSKSLPKETFFKLLRAGAVKPVKEGTRTLWDFDKAKAKLLLENEYEVI